ncbi:helix-turn-helix domain-containing protein [Achromobacter ruhlandii]|uniref:helix-turn-helix domain-containing protein n=1 Tax=Achromobacter ruhlandii TaxID=72557 RepID=UPI0006C3F41F|nr:XRE family transcriptional regulator [Achromobacter ruhlandii]AMG45736.1 XRE family transcriptional regulator [Achromobacter xylosoxidans]CUI74265.1 Antitoxin PezA [Achromobacter ruhlandii]CUJ09910.1 Antitoxin PezA [Achromobacter ruhlandii]CUJ89005.1 Antitoxin PezA [Achromobacter ruhlandii]
MSNILHITNSDSDVLTHVGANLKRLRKLAGLSQSALADASGISRRMIAGLEAGNANISLSSLDKLAQALDVGFVDLVSDPARERRRIEARAWRGKRPGSQAVLLGAAPASCEAQLWIWSLGPGETYVAEPDPQGWHEMIYVIEGTLLLELSGVTQPVRANDFAIYSSAQPYSYCNDTDTLLRFVRNVLR